MKKQDIYYLDEVYNFIDKDFVKQVNEDYENIKISDMEFMDCLKSYTTENAYSTAFVRFFRVEYRYLFLSRLWFCG